MLRKLKKAVSGANKVLDMAYHAAKLVKSGLALVSDALLGRHCLRKRGENSAYGQPC